MISKIKICGITNIEDAKFCIENKVDYLGFIFYQKSPRHIHYTKAKKIIEELKETSVKFVGVFVNEKIDQVNLISRICDLDLIQIHGDENDNYFNTLRKYNTKKIIRTIKINNDEENKLKQIDKDLSDYLLFEPYSKNKYGNTGKTLSIKNKIEVSLPFFIAGGLDENNVLDIIKKTSPYAVDINSGVEISPGKKDHKKVKNIINIIRGVQN